MIGTRPQAVRRYRELVSYANGDVVLLNRVLRELNKDHAQLTTQMIHNEIDKQKKEMSK